MARKLDFFKIKDATLFLLGLILLPFVLIDFLIYIANKIIITAKDVSKNKLNNSENS